MRILIFKCMISHQELDRPAVIQDVAVVTFGEKCGSEYPMYPYGVAIDQATNNILVVDNSNHQICRYTSEGIYLSCFRTKKREYTDLASPRGITINTNGDVIVTGNHDVVTFNTSGDIPKRNVKEGQETRALKFPWGVTTDQDGLIYVCDHDNHRIQVYNKEGQFVRTFGEDALQYPTDICINPTNGDIYIANSGLNKICIYTKSGEPSGFIDFAMIGLLHIKPMFLAMQCDREEIKLFCTDDVNHCVHVFQNGVYTAQIGRGGSEPGNFCHPRGIALDQRGNIIICDRHNNRVQILKCKFD